MLDFSLIVKLLVKDAVFEYQPGRGSNKTKFNNLYFCRSRVITARGLFDLYQRKVRGNWTLGCALDNELHVIEGDKSDVDVLERANAFRNDKIDNDNNSINNEE